VSSCWVVVRSANARSVVVWFPILGLVFVRGCVFVVSFFCSGAFVPLFFLI
jgi:hypothetical protein